MPEHIYTSREVSVASTNWSAIWAGMFTYLAIWSVFGLLGEAIFASVAPGRAAAGVSVGMGIWTVILTIIAMFVAGRTTGRLAGVEGATDALVHGIVMFGLSMAASLVILGVGEVARGALATGLGPTHALLLSAGLGWTGFIALFLGWLAALGGASSTIHSRAMEPPADQVRRAA